MTASGVTVKPSKAPPSPSVLRRKQVVAEAGLEHKDIRAYLLDAHGKDVTRQAVTGALNGYFASSDLWIEKAIVECCQQALRAQGKEKRAEQVTMKFMGWEE